VSHRIGPFHRVGETGFWWTSSVYVSATAWARNLNCEGPDVGQPPGPWVSDTRCVV